MKITQELTPDVARRVLLDYAERQNDYNKSWAWWAYDAPDIPHEVSEGVFVTVVDSSSENYRDSYGAISDHDGYVVFRFLAEDQGEELYFKITGEISSYTTEWRQEDFRAVKGVQRTVVVWE